MTSRPLRASSYNIWTHLKNGSVFGLHGYMGTSLIISEEVWEALKSGDMLTDPQMASCVDELRAEGFITHFTHAEERDLVTQLHEITHERRQQAHFVLIPSFDCNFRCSYCFERDLQDQIDSFKAPAEMAAEAETNCGTACRASDEINLTPETLLNITDAVVDDFYAAVDQTVEARGWPRVSKNITLFGGEPLWERNAPQIIRAVRMGMERGFKFSAVTNGYDLEHFADVLGEGAIESLNISVDGVQEFHDTRRFLEGGGPTFDKIMRNIQWLIDEKPDVRIAIRINFDEHNMAHIQALRQDFKDRGWMAHPNFFLFANIVYHKEGGRRRLRQDRQLLDSVLSMNGSSGIGLDCFNAQVSQRLLQSLDQQKPYQFSGAYCAANAGMQICSPDGKIYKCWEDIGGAQSYIGRFSPEYRIDAAQDKAWTDRTVGNLPNCPDCRFAMICSGGCAIHAHQQLGDIDRNYCDNFDKRYEISVKNVESQLLGYTKI